MQALSDMVNTVGKMFSEVNWAYVAGLIDADGAIMATIESHDEKKYGFRVRVTVKISQKRKSVLEWIQNSIQIGHISRNKSTYDWIVRSQQDCIKLLTKLHPYIRVKKKQINLAVEILNFEKDTYTSLLYTAKLADTLASFNVRSRNRRKNYASKIQEYISRND